ncbi:hypothetical protein BZA05DRAFT_444643 [Tricharina praecox]|uniref:uncharacterized protein n=1 Tax=Tricharina praecox TaxID=43433 RepID=UPI00221EFEC0|nr:uncharacterized protein BZA05DRAFT_444643 [Tricharina praecox]KAI5852082.1 hypothetical protein BZA05DRAFT_444643 [Tricharina praecox]
MSGNQHNLCRRAPGLATAANADRPATKVSTSPPHSYPAYRINHSARPWPVETGLGGEGQEVEKGRQTEVQEGGDASPVGARRFSPRPTVEDGRPSHVIMEWKEKPEWIATAEETVGSVWKEFYRGYSTAHPSPAIAPPETTEGASNRSSSLDKWNRKRPRRLCVVVDMMEKFQLDPPLPGEQIAGVVGYRRAKLSEPQWRDLARMALD